MFRIHVQIKKIISKSMYVHIMAILAGINILKELQELQLKSLTLVNSLTLKNLE